ncbi:MAG TPA: molecular chaperone DnaJ [Longimicrobiales bacterium]|nr:molecular chaperone DnaJ [Longimicrobiales bacterium]
MRDYYEILGVRRDADAEAIKRAYRKLALQYHPDRNGGAKDSEDRFKEATEAYEVLRDGDKRAAYDRYGHAGVKGAAGPGFAGGFNFADALEIFMRDFGGFGGGMEDLFGMAGGGGRRGRSVRKGPDLRVRLSLTLAEVASGVKRSIKLDLLDACDTCAGTGAAQGAAPVPCSTCGGAGEVRRVQRSFLGQLVTVTPCPDCGGEGQRIPNPCTSCEGRGVQPQPRKIEVQIPAGVSTGDYITLRGQGNGGVRGGPRGDILVVLEVEDDARFVRDGADLIFDLPITFTQAALGTEVDVPLVPDGTSRVRIAAGTQSGRLLRLRGKGLPQLQGAGRGDVIVRVIVWTPTELSAEQEALLRKLARIEAEAPAHVDEGGRGFWSKVREAFTGS